MEAYIRLQTPFISAHIKTALRSICCCGPLSRKFTFGSIRYKRHMKHGPYVISFLEND